VHVLQATLSADSKNAQAEEREKRKKHLTSAIKRERMHEKKGTQRKGLSNNKSPPLSFGTKNP